MLCWVEGRQFWGLWTCFAIRLRVRHEFHQMGRPTIGEITVNSKWKHSLEDFVVRRGADFCQWPPPSPSKDQASFKESPKEKWQSITKIQHRKTQWSKCSQEVFDHSEEQGPQLQRREGGERCGQYLTYSSRQLHPNFWESSSFKGEEAESPDHRGNLGFDQSQKGVRDEEVRC